MTGLGRRWRRYAAVTAALLLVAGVGAIAWRVLRPAAALDRSSRPYPATAAAHEPERYASLPDAPLIVQGRLRVFAEKRRVWADADVANRHQLNPYWSYRRWPGQVVGVVAIEEPAPIVVIRWSDGAVTGVDARAGRIAWEKRIAPTDAQGYTGRRTGAQTVYRPRGMYTTGRPDGAPVLVLAEPGGAAGYEPWTGARLWTRSTGCDGDTASGGWTAGTAYVARCGDRLDIVDAGTGLPLGTWSGSDPKPWGCQLGRSGCRLVASGGTNFTVGADGAVAPAPNAPSNADFVVRNGYVDWRRDSHVGVVDAATGRQRWRVPLRGYVVAADDNLVYLVTKTHWLVALDAATGLDRARVQIPAGRDWRAGYVYAAHGFVALERVIGREQDDDASYYYAMSTVELLGV